MKKLTFVLLAFILANSLIFAGGSQETPSGDLLERIKAKGEITIAMEGTWAPWTYHNENGELVGYDVEVGQAIAEKLGVKATFIEGEWDGLLAGLESGRYDLMINGVDITEERQKKYDFSIPYVYNSIVVIVQENNTSIHSMEDLKGKKTANTISSTYAEIAESYGATVTPVDDLAQTIELLLAGRIDATLNADVSFYDYKKAQPDAPIKIACQDPQRTSVGIPMRKGEDAATLREAVNTALEELLEDGTISALSIKYFGGDKSK